MNPDPPLRIFVCATPTNMTYSFDRLLAKAKEVFDQDPFSGHLFLFFNRPRDRVKVLYWDADGFCIWYKRLEAGTFQLPRDSDGRGGIELDPRTVGPAAARAGPRHRPPTPTLPPAQTAAAAALRDNFFNAAAAGATSPRRRC